MIINSFSHSLARDVLHVLPLINAQRLEPVEPGNREEGSISENSKKFKAQLKIAQRTRCPSYASY